MQRELGSLSCIIKPRSDGCSAGIVRLNSSNDFQRYVELVQKRVPFIPERTFSNQINPIEMPYVYDDDFLLESFIETDYIRIAKNELVHRPKSGWIELTVGVLEQNMKYHSLNPSITIAEGEVLSVEEKFQGGTGVNITPPLESIISSDGILFIRKSIEEIARALNIQNYARIDIFYNVLANTIYVIEANSLPALTPATVLYQQALAEHSPIFPREFLESLVNRDRR
jgi:D-alanine-D-alanine ligase-like ATP-grasp enzyme